MKVVEEKPITMAEAKEIMMEREKKGELGYEQKLAIEHLKKFTKLGKKESEALLEELNSIVRMSPETAIQIVSILPKNPDEVRLAFSKEKFSLTEEEINKILEAVRKYL